MRHELGLYYADVVAMAKLPGLTETDLSGPVLTLQPAPCKEQRLKHGQPENTS